jgi:hypothetical protein
MIVATWNVRGLNDPKIEILDLSIVKKKLGSHWRKYVLLHFSSIEVRQVSVLYWRLVRGPAHGRRINHLILSS